MSLFASRWCCLRGHRPRASLVGVIWAMVLLMAGSLATPDRTFGSDAQWSDAFWRSGTDGIVYAVAQYGNLVVAGGGFGFVNQTAVSNVASWDGAVWRAMGNPGGAVRALLVYNGDLIAGGDFSVARWDGSSWVSLAGLGGSVCALGVYNGDLIAGGRFLGGIAKWNGSSWAVLGSGVSGSFQNNDWVFGPEVDALAAYGGNLIVGGMFKAAGGDSAYCIARWNGSSWSPLGSGMRQSYWWYRGPGVFALSVYGGSLYVGGNFQNAEGVPSANCIARWNGSQWNTVGTGMDDPVYSLVVHGQRLIAGGMFLYASGQRANKIAAWDGTAWSQVSSGLTTSNSEAYHDEINTNVFALASIDEVLFAGGTFSVAGDSSTANIARWDGLQWGTLGPPPTGSGFYDPLPGCGAWRYVTCLCPFGGQIVAGGAFCRVGESWKDFVASWDGISWHPLGSGVFTTEYLLCSSQGVHALVAYGGGLVAGGQFTTAGGNPASNIAIWNGTSWSPLGGGVTGGDPPLVAVNALAVFDGELIAAGNFSSPGVNVARWDGVSWSAMGQNLNGIVRALTVYRGNLIAGGDFSNDSQGIYYIAEWSGSDWEALCSDLGCGWTEGRVWALGAYDSLLAVGGDFAYVRDDLSGRHRVNYVATWDGQSWSALGSGVSRGGCVYSFCGDSTGLYVGGEFNPPGPYIARWTGSAWEQLGSGVSGSVWAIHGFEGNLLVGGDFQQAGGKPSYYIAEWDLANAGVADGTQGAEGLTGVTISPNPISGLVRVNYSVPQASRVEVTVYDVSGRVVRSLAYEAEDKGKHSVGWDGTDLHGRRVGSGIYFVEIRAGRTSQVSKVVVTR